MENMQNYSSTSDSISLGCNNKRIMKSASKSALATAVFAGIISMNVAAETYSNTGGGTDTVTDTEYSTPINSYSDVVSVSGPGSVLNGTRLDIKSDGLSAGVRVLNGGAVNLTDSSVKTTAPSGNGVIVSGDGSSLSAINTTVDSQFIGLDVRSGASAILKSLTLTTQGDYAHGIQADGVNSNVSADGLILTTNGSEFAYGLRSVNGGGILATNGQIETFGDFGHGVIAEDAGSQMVIQNSDIRTDGQHSYGARSSNGGVTHVKNSSLTIKGNGSYGLNAYDGGSTLHGHNTSVETFGATVNSTTASGVVAEFGGAVSLTGTNDVTTHGDEAMGLLAQVRGAVAADTRVTAENTQVTTTGKNAIGVMACSLVDGGSSACASPKNIGGADVGSNAFVEISNSTINTSGESSNGIYSLGKASAVTATNTDIVTTGYKAHGVSVVDGTVNLVGSTVLAEGADAFVATVNNGTLNVDGGSLRSNFGALQSDGATIVLSNGAQIKGGNGVLLEVASEKQASFNLDGDVLAIGDIVFGTNAESNGDGTLNSYTNVSLNNVSHWKGATDAIETLALNQGSQWTVTGNSTVAQMSLDQGRVIFDTPAAGSFKTLSVTGDLSGNGSFVLNTDLAAVQGDLLKVGGTIEGQHTLIVADSGREAQGDALMLVDGNGGLGKFDLYGGKVDAGVFRYELEQRGDDWYLAGMGGVAPDPELIPEPENLSKGANAAVAQHAASGALIGAQMNTLVKRLGELRMGKDNGGLWTRGFTKEQHLDTGSSRAFQQQVNGFEIGADKALPFADGKLYLGGMVGKGEGRQNFGEGSKGSIDSTMLGGYATYVDQSGVYVDSVLKYTHLDNEVDITSNTGEKVDAKYKNHAVAADIEIGKQIDLGKGWFVEPQLALQAFRVSGVDYTASNGLKVEQDAVTSVQSRVGSLVGRNLKLDNGMTVQPYAKASWLTEHAGGSQVKVNGVRLDSNLPGSRAEIGGGVILQTAEKHKFYIDAEYSKGGGIEQPYAVNLGYRYMW
ncbi:autotransporter outer membrane beta-barrel domain-containing protein [Pseudomonas zeae]|uniref:autotransporter outer membrane beta-barrel domain-containing protein n=1 Tax=Pseudomonas zeae TaxID=2745510 RepID=UPI003CFC1913